MSNWVVAVIATSGAFLGALLGAVVNLVAEARRQDHQRQERQAQQEYDRAERSAERQADLYERLLTRLTELPYQLDKGFRDLSGEVIEAITSPIHTLRAETLLYGADGVRELTTDFPNRLREWLTRWTELNKADAERERDQRHGVSTTLWASYWEVFHPYVEDLAAEMRNALRPD